VSVTEPRVVPVSGGNRGIGLAAVEGLARAGLRVVLGSRDLAAGERARASIDADGDRIMVYELDVADRTSIKRAVAEISREPGRLDVLVNNAGVVLDAGQRAEAADPDIVGDTLRVNLFGAWTLITESLPLLRASREGRIINVSSGMGQLSEMGGGSPGYRVSKAALNALTRMLSAELGGAIKVNSVCPGWVKTDTGGAGASRTPQQGADTIIWLAALPAKEAPTGKFLRDREPIPW
jgi:NAD(P)-dependent dehydrogenase (short-subunit alcohol dehydrogenase family)